MKIRQPFSKPLKPVKGLVGSIPSLSATFLLYKHYRRSRLGKRVSFLFKRTPHQWWAGACFAKIVAKKLSKTKDKRGFKSYSGEERDLRRKRTQNKTHYITPRGGWTRSLAEGELEW